MDGDSESPPGGSHLVPVAVLRDHVHQQDVLGARDESGEADLTVREHPPGTHQKKPQRHGNAVPSPRTVPPVLPARFGDDHLRPDVVEGLPELRLLQGQPDVALQVRVRRHGGRSGGGGEARLQVWTGRKSFRIEFSQRRRRRKRRRTLTSDGLHGSTFKHRTKQKIQELFSSSGPSKRKVPGQSVPGLAWEESVSS